MPIGLSLIKTEIDSDDPNNNNNKKGSAGWLGTEDQQKGRPWIWKMGRTKGNLRPVNRGKQVLVPTDPGILHLTFRGCGKYPIEWACVACTWAALWQAGKRQVEPLQLEGLESEGMPDPSRFYTIQESQFPFPGRKLGCCQKGNESYLTKKQKQTSKRPVSTTMSKTLHKREPEIWKSI